MVLLINVPAFAPLAARHAGMLQLAHTDQEGQARSTPEGETCIRVTFGHKFAEKRKQ